MKNNEKRTDVLAELNEELENYFSNTIIPQLFVDANLILRKFTPPAMKQFSLKKEDIGKPLDDITENFRYPNIVNNIKVVIETGENLEKEIQTTDMRWYQLNILPYRVRKENKTNGVVITFVDITPRIKDLKEQEKLIAEHELLLDSITHDLKNPIFGIGLSIQFLKKQIDENDKQFSKYVDNIEKGLMDLQNVINDLVITRWQSSRYQASEELLDLQNILEDVRLTLAPQILESRAMIKQEISISEVTFVRRKLRSVMYNLLSNAIKYTPNDRSPVILISSYVEDVYMVIRVTDNGIGIDKEDLETIFHKFQRVESEVEGSGVGLYLIKSIIDSTGGKITVESTPGKGSIFKVFLKLTNTNE